MPGRFTSPGQIKCLPRRTGAGNTARPPGAGVNSKGPVGLLNYAGRIHFARADQTPAEENGRGKHGSPAGGGRKFKRIVGPFELCRADSLRPCRSKQIKPLPEENGRGKHGSPAGGGRKFKRACGPFELCRADSLRPSRSNACRGERARETRLARRGRA